MESGGTHNIMSPFFRIPHANFGLIELEFMKIFEF